MILEVADITGKRKYAYDRKAISAERSHDHMQTYKLPVLTNSKHNLEMDLTARPSKAPRETAQRSPGQMRLLEPSQKGLPQNSNKTKLEQQTRPESPAGKYVQLSKNTAKFFGIMPPSTKYVSSP